jgi:CMP-N-acetylneuraminic acid synthetase
VIIFIPIKHVSQRVPNKNFRKINNTSLYKRCLYKLKDFNVYVDTDSETIINEIKADKKLKHVTVYHRCDRLLGHEISVCDIINNFINIYNIKNSVICQLHVTSPFLKIETLLSAYKMMDNHDSVAACNIYQNRLWRKEDYGYAPINHNPLKLEQTQDLPVFYEENSLFYIFRSEDFKKTKLRIGVNPHFYPCGFPENIDIDTEDDWQLVKNMR